MGLALTAAAGDARAATLEAAYVVLGPQGAVARAVLKDATACPAISIDGTARPMTVRALPDTGANARFPVLVCEAVVPSGTRAAIVEGTSLPVPKASLKAIAGFGDTGCRLKSKALANDEDDDEDRGKFQDCDKPSKWPFAQLAQGVAAAKPDLVIHVGDYVYRESACPQGDKGCKGSPHGDDWATWKADFFAPAAPALLAAPWIVVRGNHEICSRAGHGYFRLLEPTPVSGPTPPACVDGVSHYTATAGGKSFIVMDTSDAADTCKHTACKSKSYATDFAAMRPAPGTWLATHRPIWGVRPGNKTINATLQQALSASDGKLPAGIELSLAGHIHLWEALSFADRRTPQFVLGGGGTLLAKKIKRGVAGMKIGGTTIADGRVEHRWGFTIFEPAAGGSGWSATVRDVDGKPRFACAIAAGDISCR
jgi:hypothetical protein